LNGRERRARQPKEKDGQKGARKKKKERHPLRWRETGGNSEKKFWEIAQKKTAALGGTEKRGDVAKKKE